jgi:phosphate starvation-inducible protein PhoH and related proteins
VTVRAPAVSRFEFVPEPLDNQRLANLCGPLDENIRQIASALGVQINRRGERFSIQGSLTAGQTALTVLQNLYRSATAPVDASQIQLLLTDSLQSATGLAEAESLASLTSPPLLTRRADLQGRTPNQRAYLRNILSHDISFGIGPAGTGKTYLAVACAVDALERDAVKRIVLTRPAVEAGERLGFLPGDLSQKVDPYLRPLYDALYELMGLDKAQRMFEKQAIEVAPLAYMRGRTLSHSFIILDEAQNTTAEQMKMFLTRMGFGSKMVITGDVTQIDLPRAQTSGLLEARKILRQVEGLAFTEFNASDVVRHPLVARIVAAYEQNDPAR